MVPGDVSIPMTFGKILWYMGELVFKFVPGTLLGLGANIADPTVGPVPAGIGPIMTPVTTDSVVDYLGMVLTGEQYSALVHHWDRWVAISMAISLILTAGCIYCFIRLRQLRHWEHMQWEAAAHTVAAQDLPRTHLRWNRVQEQIQSDSEQNWRLAILEADIMLAELLDVQGFRGDTIADKLRNANRVSFNSIESAWEAHKIRNRVAHDGSALHLPHSEARRVIQLYERVFREFRVIE